MQTRLPKRRCSNGHERNSPGAVLAHHPGQDLNIQSVQQRSIGMKKIRGSSRSFNSTPLGSWGVASDQKRYDRAAIKLAERAGMSLPIAQVFADLNGLGRRR